MKQTRLILISFIAAALSACSPHELRENPQPNVDIPGHYAHIESDEMHKKFMAQPWWVHFQRPALNAIIAQAWNKNNDVKAAIARMQAAIEMIPQTRSSRLPNIGLEGNYNKDWRGSDAQRADGEIGAALGWELDIWDRIGNQIKADEFEAVASIRDIETARLSLSAEITDAYFNAIASNQKLALLSQQIKLDKELLKLLEVRLQNGIGTKIDVLQQQVRVADNETLIPLAEADLAIYEHRLDVLVGETPDKDLRVPMKEQIYFKGGLPPIGVPASLILQRPDLQGAQARLMAADANIGAAIADRLPAITLDGSYVYSDNGLYSGPISALTAMFIQPLLDWGKREAAVKQNKALYEEELATFTQAYLEAVEDVENALVQEKKQREFINRLEIQRAYLQQTVDVAQSRYKEGVDDYLPVINALQELREIERTLIDEFLRLVQFRIALHRAIGGPIHGRATDGCPVKDDLEIISVPITAS